MPASVAAAEEAEQHRVDRYPLHPRLGRACARTGRRAAPSPAAEKPAGSRDVSPSRCPWSLGVDDAYTRYHDEEWGVPVHLDSKHFEFLVLESAQAGLSWATVLRKREGYRRAFADFDPERVARFNRRSVERLVKDAGIIRNRQKIVAAIGNARAFLAIRDAFGSFDSYVWRFVGGRPIVNRWTEQPALPATSPESDALSRDLKRRGFGFVGSTIIYAHMQATGLVNDHLVDCFRHAECARLGTARG